MANWTVNPSSVEQEEASFQTTIVTFYDGLEVRGDLVGVVRRRFKCLFNAEYEHLIYAHFKGQKGSLYTFDFTHPETSEVIRVRYDNSPYKRKKIVGNLYEVEVEIVEVLGETS